jgi:hypothetical protein
MLSPSVSGGDGLPAKAMLERQRAAMELAVVR